MDVALPICAVLATIMCKNYQRCLATERQATPDFSESANCRKTCPLCDAKPARILAHYNKRMVTIDTIKNVPSVERWTHIMETSSPEEALRLRQLAIECLDATNSQDQEGWGRHIGIAERVLRERGIPRYEGDN